MRAVLAAVVAPNNIKVEKNDHQKPISSTATIKPAFNLDALQTNDPAKKFTRNRHIHPGDVTFDDKSRTEH